MNRFRFVCLFLLSVFATGPLAAFAADPAATPSLRRADLFTLEDGTLVFRVETTDPVPASAIRILADPDGPQTGLAGLGADLMLEGGLLYEKTEDPREWAWDERGPVPMVQAGTVWTALFPCASDGPAIRWAVELLAPDWTVAQRLPKQGLMHSGRAALPRFPVPAYGVPPPDLSLLKERISDSFTAAVRARIEAKEWVPVQEIGWSWSNAVFASPLPVQVTIQCPGHDPVVAVPSAQARLGSAVKWSGQTGDLAWTLLLEPDGDRLDATLDLASGADQSVLATVAVGLPEAPWTWSDSLYENRCPDREADAAQGSPFGLARRQSLYPFAAVSSPVGVLRANLRPEAGAYRLSWNPASRQIRVSRDLALSSMTAAFPGHAAVSARFSAAVPSGHAFRDAVQDGLAAAPEPRAVPPLLGHTPVGRAGRIPGVWLRTVDALPLPPAQSNAVTFVRMAPWTVRRDLPSGMGATERDALRLLRFEAVAESSAVAVESAAVLLAASRTVKGEIRTRIRDGRAEWTVSANPAFMTVRDAPWNRSMCLWNTLLSSMTPGASGLLVEWPAEDEFLEYNRAAMAVANHPLAGCAPDFAPGILPMDLVADGLAPIREMLHRYDRVLVLDLPPGTDPRAAIQGDAVVESITTNLPGFSDVARRRTLAGPRPWLLRFDPRRMDEAALDALLDACVMWAIVPDTPPDSPEDARVRSAQTLAARLQNANWNPVGFAAASAPDLQLESYGREGGDARHLVARNPTDHALTSDVRLTDVSSPSLWVDVRSAQAQILKPENRSVAVRVTLPPHSVKVFDVTPLSGWDGEAVFLEAWPAARGEGRAAGDNLGSLRAELAAEAFVQIAVTESPDPAGRRVFTLRVENRGAGPLIVSDVVLPGSKGTAVRMDPRILGPGEAAVMPGAFDASDLGGDGWIQARWRMQRGDREWAGCRWAHPEELQADPVTP